jgi:hypothetical protein
VVGADRVSTNLGLVCGAQLGVWTVPCALRVIERHPAASAAASYRWPGVDRPSCVMPDGNSFDVVHGRGPVALNMYVTAQSVDTPLSDQPVQRN